MPELAERELFALDRLPADGAIVIVSSPEIRSHVRREINDELGSEVTGKTKVIVGVSREQIADALVGVRVPVFLHEAFVATAPKDAAEFAASMARSVNTVVASRKRLRG
ncbi:hypothetical protein OOZ54_12820 [Rhodopseudomonas palustris]|uniref:hypothetical protein n=1 Tax=Rhodopseudomonas palustris TaxID=1076 RepID=UPI0022EFEFA0|nr:hypothetical protein [Rhodopseudomonas palustris]WBU27577.1 hypothetical protein OOZ54_12820 [Rhodopseudomonas palustris]